MKTLIIIGVVLAILSIYFVVNSENKILVSGSEVTPTGTDVPKLILNKAKELFPVFTAGEIKNSADSAINDFQPKMVENLVSDMASKITNLIKKPIENKISETLCPTK